MDNLPSDPPNSGNGIPPPFGHNFNPHSNPIDPNNPYQSQPSQSPSSDLPQQPNNDSPHHKTHSDVAQARLRDEHGHFLAYDHFDEPLDSIGTNPSSPSDSSQDNSSSFPAPFSIKEETKYSEKKDPPLLNLTFTNPITYFKKWVDKLLKNQDISLHLRIKPFAAMGLIMTVSVVGSGAFAIGRYFFPNSSPVFHRQVVYPGLIQKGDKNQYLLMSSDGTPWKLKPKNPSLNLENLVGRQTIVTGNLTKEKYLIEVSELIVSDTPSQNTNSINNQTIPNIPNQDLLPKLYSDIKWDKTERKVILFTSGKRRIEQEGIYMESEQLTKYPQTFVDYYTNQLINSGFKETLNSQESSGTTITYSKDNLFLTFGVKNIYSGSGDNKKTVGYKAYIEHN